jgi:dihydrodipicolinate synthase/N-acetylneuraminate lyase
MHRSQLPPEIAALLRRGIVIPAHPLALDARRRLDERRQRALTRYYIDAGSGGLAVGVHATQFAIRENGLYEPVLALAMEQARAWAKRPLVMIAGLAGKTAAAKREAGIARSMGYHCGMLSLGAMKGASIDELAAHCAAVAAEIPLVGFYLQSAVGGIALPAEFWRRFAAIDNVVAIKTAPFDRYRTLDVVRGVVAARAEDRVTLYTGNDDHIVLDLLVPFAVKRGAEEVRVRIKGGLLGHWSVWTRSAVSLLKRIQEGPLDEDLLALDSRVTDCNSAFFDVAHNFAGCIPGCHEVLRRQGLVEGTWCLDSQEKLSPGQAEEIDRVCRDHADLADDDFVRANLHRWLS